MRSPSSTGVSSILAAIASLIFVANPLAACLSGEAISLGSNYDGGQPGPDSSSSVVQDSSAEAVADAPGEADADSAGEPVDDGVSDAPSPPGAPICIPNASFESGASGDAPGQSGLLTDPPGWQVCSSSAATSQACSLPPTDGSSYLGLSIGFAPFLVNPASVDATLCQPLEAGVAYSLSIELALDAPDNDASPPGEPPALQVRASNTACDPQADLLVRFSGAANACGWTALCETFVPQQTYTHLVLIPEVSSSTGLVFKQTNVLVDDLRSGGRCSAR